MTFEKARTRTARDDPVTGNVHRPRARRPSCGGHARTGAKKRRRARSPKRLVSPGPVFRRFVRTIKLKRIVRVEFRCRVRLINYYCRRRWRRWRRRPTGCVPLCGSHRKFFRPRPETSLARAAARRKRVNERAKERKNR